MAKLPILDLPALTAAATSFLVGHHWCERVVSATPEFVITGVLGVFRCALIPAHPGADSTVWVVVGDLPPAYLAYEATDTWQDALGGYVAEMQRWVDAVRSHQDPGDDIIPVNAPATIQIADFLTSRLNFLQTKLIDVDPESVASDV